MSLFKQITEKPWERKGIIGGLKPEGTFKSPAERVALNFFLITASIVFSLFGVSYYIRMELPDWLPIAEPTSLWFNTGLLVMSSVLFQWARNVVGNGGSKNVKIAFFGGGVFAILFIAAQLQTWEELLSRAIQRLTSTSYLLACTRSTSQAACTYGLSVYSEWLPEQKRRNNA